MPLRIPHPTLIVLTTIVGVATAVRIVNLNATGFNSDEAVYAGQGASLAGNPNYTEYFPVFRAHPMLIQSMLSLIYREGEHDVAARVLIVVLGAATIIVVYLLGAELYSRGVGLLAAAMLALMPYHVVVTRQVLLDGPMVLFSTLTLLCVAKFARTQRLSWMLAAGGAMGLTMLSKESSIVLVGSVYAFFALTPRIRRPVIGSLLAFSVTVAMFLLHPVSVTLSGHTDRAKAYLVWQLVRRPNHTWTFYAETVPVAIGPLVLVAAGLAIWLVRRQPAWREILLVSWMAVPAVAFTLWPVKGFQYLLPGAPAIAVLAARGLLGFRWPVEWLRRVWPSRWISQPVLTAAAIVLVLSSLLTATLPKVSSHANATGLAGSGGIPGGREAGKWIRDFTPEGAVIMTLGPSMANIIQFYGHRHAYGLSVSPNPLRRNPSYEPILNPDASLRLGDLQYVVWDAFSARRSTHFSEYLLQLARRYNGRVVHTEYVGRPGEEVPVIVVYEVRP
jgi:4-amino-4-deoxy-L-arabinose transferase-like glycosyltransferase